MLTSLLCACVLMTPAQFSAVIDAISQVSAFTYMHIHIMYDSWEPIAAPLSANKVESLLVLWL